MEDVERGGGDNGVTHGVLLEKMSLDGARLFIPPGALFIEQKGDVAFWILRIHDCDVLLQHILDFPAFADCPIILVTGELGG